MRASRALRAFIPPLHLRLWLRVRHVTAVAAASALLAIPVMSYVTQPVRAADMTSPAVLFDRRYTGGARGLWNAVGVSTDVRLTPTPPMEHRLDERRALRGATKRILIEDEIRILMRLVVAATVGGIIGVERRSAKSYAGVRTFSLVSLGAAIFMSVCLVAFPNGDPSRIAAAISSSVGFIGGGVMSKNSKHSRGLTTASSVWLAAGLGIAAASGLFVMSYVGAVLTVLIARYARFDSSLHLIRGDPLAFQSLSDEPHPADTELGHLLDPKMGERLEAPDGGTFSYSPYAAGRDVVRSDEAGWDEESSDISGDSSYQENGSSRSER